MLTRLHIENFPIPFHHTWPVLDSTKLGSYMECPRKYFYNYLLGWQIESHERNHLVFGQAFHAGMELLRCSDYSAEAVKAAWERFLSFYREQFPEETDALQGNKTPAKALEAYTNYAVDYANQPIQTLYTEVAGTAPVQDDVCMHFKIDFIGRGPDGIRFDDYKTGSRLDQNWMKQWSLSHQMNFYNHVLLCLFPVEEIECGYVTGFFFYKDSVAIKPVVVRKSPEMLEDWLLQTQHYLRHLARDFEKLSATNEEQLVMEAFPKNTMSCSKYFGCPYMDLCAAWPNPCRSCQHGVPPGMKVEFWDPRSHEEKASTIVRILPDGTNEITKKEQHTNGPTPTVVR